MRIAFGRAGFSGSEPCRLIAELKPEWELVDGDGTAWETLVKTADVISPMVSPVGAEQLTGSRARLIQQFGVGLETVDMHAATAAGIPVCNLPGDMTGNADSVAELALVMTLTIIRQVDQARAAARVGDSSVPVARSVFGRTVALVGLGAVGSAIAKRLAAFDVTVIGLRAHPSRGVVPGVASVRSIDDLAETLPTVDGVILCAPGRPDGKPILSAEMLALLPGGAFVVNVGRGSLIDEGALLTALDSGQLSGAGLDVYAHEPPAPDDPLVAHPHVIATPHIAGATQSMFRQSVAAFIENVERMEAGDALRWRAN